MSDFHVVCHRTAARSATSLRIPNLGVDGNLATELRLRAVHRDASRERTVPSFLMFQIENHRKRTFHCTTIFKFQSYVMHSV